MAVKRDYYEILGVHRDADDEAVKRAYRKLAKKYHPDTNAGNARAEQKFKEITEAYGVLSDPEKKKLYDQFGHAAFDGSGAGAGTGAYGQQSGFQNGGYREYHFEGGHAEDIFGDIFGDLFHGKGFERAEYARKGSNVQAEVSISFEEAVFGCDKTITLQNMDRADGSVQSLRVHIPAGIDSGKSIRLKGKGMPGMHNGANGDLLLKVNVLEKPGYERKGMDIYTAASIPFTTAVFGGEVRVPTLYGDVLCKIREGTQSGTKIRLKGKGVVSMKHKDQYGDQYVNIQIQVPRHLNPEAKEKLKEFEQAYQKEDARKKQFG